MKHACSYSCKPLMFSIHGHYCHDFLRQIPKLKQYCLSINNSSRTAGLHCVSHSSSSSCDAVTSFRLCKNWIALLQHAMQEVLRWRRQCMTSKNRLSRDRRTVGNLTELYRGGVTYCRERHVAYTCWVIILKNLTVRGHRK